MKLFLFVVGLYQGVYPVPCYLVQTDDGTNVLIDTGYRPGSFGEAVAAEDAPVRTTPEDLILPQLARLGLAPENIDLLVATHLDVDHDGFHDGFPNAEIVVQRAALAAARASDDPRHAANRDHWDAPGLRWREVEGDLELLPGLELLLTPGHVPGHQSVLVRLPETGPVLLTIDAVMAAEYADPDAPRHPFDLDPVASAATARRLAELAARESVALTVYGHDADQWPTLRLAPEFYA